MNIGDFGELAVSESLDPRTVTLWKFCALSAFPTGIFDLAEAILAPQWALCDLSLSPMFEPARKQSCANTGERVTSKFERSIPLNRGQKGSMMMHADLAIHLPSVSASGMSLN